MYRNSESSYGVVAKLLHWLIALLILGLLGVGWVMEDIDPQALRFQVYGVHKALGIAVLFLGALRLIWHAYTPPPAAIPSQKPWEHMLAKGIHVVFYAAAVLMPLSGWALSSAAGYPVSWFGLFELPMIVTKDESAKDFFGETHEILGVIIAVCVALHVAGALKHHVIDKDLTLKRMLPFGR